MDTVFSLTFVFTLVMWNFCVEPRCNVGNVFRRVR